MSNMHEFQAALEVLQISRIRGEDKRKGRQTEKKKKKVRKNTQKKEKQIHVCHLFYPSDFAIRLASLCIVMHFSSYMVI